MQGGDDQIALLFFQNALLLNLVNDVFQFIFGDAGGFLLGLDGTGEQPEQQDKRLHNCGECGESGTQHQRQLVRMGFGVGLGEHLAERQHQNGHDNRGDGSAGRAEVLGEKNCCQRRGTDVDNIVSHQNRREGIFVAVGDIQRLSGTFIAGVCHVLEANLVDAGKCRFRAGEQRRKSD